MFGPSGDTEAYLKTFLTLVTISFLIGYINHRIIVDAPLSNTNNNLE